MRRALYAQRCFMPPADADFFFDAYCRRAPRVQSKRLCRVRKPNHARALIDMLLPQTVLSTSADAAACAIRSLIMTRCALINHGRYDDSV